MKINTMSTLLGTTSMPLWAPADEGGAGGGADGTDVSNGGNDTSGDEGKSQTTETALGGDQPGDKPDEGTALGDGANEDGNAEDGEDGEGEGTDDADNQVPEDGVYDFGELPEGVEVTDERREAWSQQFKELGLTRAQAKALVAMRTEEAAAELEAYSADVEKRQKEHLDAAKADKDIGGDKWDESVRLANLGLKTLGGSAIKELILNSGNGNNPEMIRELRRIGELVKDDSFEAGSSREAPVSTEQSWYGETTPDTKKG